LKNKLIFEKCSWSSLGKSEFNNFSIPIKLSWTKSVSTY